MFLLLFNPMAESHHFSDGNPLQISSEKKEKWKRLSSFTSLLFFFLLLATSPASSAAGDADSTVITLGDYQGLQAFRHSLQDPHGVLHSWNDTGLAACSGGWVGIKCVMGKVVAIQLPWRGLSGRISEKLGQLTALRKLSLHDNAIGGQIPNEIGFLPDLRGLHLFNNRFSGTVPPAIGRCRLLQTIDLSNNLFIGSIPPSIANSTMLIKLNLSYNNLTGAIPTTIAANPSLNHISLDHNSLSGSIPDTWGDQIQFLSLDHNLLSGAIPTSLTNLADLKDVSFSNNQISGTIPKEIGEMQSLQTLDLSGNSIGGSLPESISKLTSLVRLNLGRNQIYGVIPESIGGMKKLEVLSLEQNRFSGVIPVMVGDVPGLSELDLSDNNLTGAIPISLERLTSLAFFNVSYNGLFGPVPSVLSMRFNSSSFRGNIQLCGYRGSLPCLLPPSASPRNSRRLSNRDMILISCGAVILFLLLLCCVLLCCLLRKRSRLGQKTKFRGEKLGAGVEAEAEAGGEAGGKLVHFDGPFVFTTDDLLCATAEIMGKSTYGTVYKATLDDGNQVAVKRLREKMAKGQREFETEANALGKIRHPNLLALRAYYLGPKGEKLLVFDFLPRGSLAAYLHARGPDTPIDWAARMKIAMGAARGLSYLHNEMSMIHGNLTSSNILLDEGTNAEIADYGLSRLMTPVANSNAGTLGYRAPELSKLKKASTRTDVYSLGVVMLELLTGKSPGETMNGIELPQWVASIVREEWTNEVFDLELMRDAAGTAGDELLNTLKLALHCVDPSPVARPEVQQVLQQLEEIKPELAGSGGGGGAAEATSPSLIDS